MKRVCTLLLAVLFVGLLLAACGKQPPAETTGSAVAESTGKPVYSPEDHPYDFDEHEFNILSVGRGSIGANDFLFDDKNPTILDSAIERRNSAIEELYNIKFVTEQKKTTANQQSPEAYKVLVRDATSGDYTYDMCVIPGYDVSQLAYEGYLFDLQQLPYFDGTNDWYDQNANETFRFHDTLYFTTGDFGINMMDQTYCIAFNKSLAAQYQVEDLYELVRTGEWTLDKMYTISKTVSTDTDGDSVTDIFGTYYWVDAVYGIVNGAGQQMVKLNEETNNYELTLNTEVTNNILERFYEMVHDSKSSLMYQHNSAKKEYIDVFGADKALFFMTTVGLLDNFRNMETDYGILPYVKYNAAQPEYHNTVAPFYMTYLCVPKFVENEERTSAVIEAIGYYSHKEIMPAYYEKKLIGQYCRDMDSSEMLDIIFSTRAYDLGYCYQPANLNKNLIYLVQSNSFDWQSRYTALEGVAVTMLDKISAAYRTTVGLE